MTRDELIARTRQLIDEGERLDRRPSLGALQIWLQLSDDLLSHGVGHDGPLPPRLADGRQAEGHRPRAADDRRTRRRPTSARSRPRRPPRCG